MAKALTKAALKKLKSDEVVKLAERLKIAGFTKMSRPEMEAAILEAQGEGGKAVSTDDVPTRKRKDDRAEKAEGTPRGQPKPRTRRDADEVDLVYVGKGGSVTLGGRRYTPGLAVRTTRIQARTIAHRFPSRFRINETG
jgi:hypothetical protein